MIKNLIFLIISFVILTLIFGYYNKPAPRTNIIGGQTDPHGCIAGAGYSWCEQKNSCIREWEEYCTSSNPKKAVFQCEAGKNIISTFYPGDDKFVDLVLDFERKFKLPRTISASGARYSNADESIVFWNKGDTAFVTENGKETYSNCTETVWTLGNKQLDETVNRFLLSQKQLSWNTSTTTSNICVFQNLQPEQELFPHYLWVRCGEFDTNQKPPKELSGTSVPVKIDYPNELSSFDLNKMTITIPRDGSLYEKDIKTIFPKEILPRLNYDSKLINARILEKVLSLLE